MENFDAFETLKNEFVIGKDTSISKIEEVLEFMPNFAEKNRFTKTIKDIYYETPEFLIETLGASVRVRDIENKRYLSIVCNYFGTKREFEREVSIDENVFENEENLIFLEDKLQELYTHKLEADVIRMLSGLRPIYMCKIYRKTLKMVNSTSTVIDATFDTVEYISKRNTYTERYLTIALDGFPGKDERFVYNRFLSELTSKVILIPEEINKAQKAKQVMNFKNEKVKKEDLGNHLESTNEEDAPPEEKKSNNGAKRGFGG